MGGEWGAKEETGMPRVLAGIGMLLGGSEAETDCLLFLSGIGMDIVLLCFCCGCKSASESTRLIYIYDGK